MLEISHLGRRTGFMDGVGIAYVTRPFYSSAPQGQMNVTEIFQQLGKPSFYAGLPVISFPSSEHCIASTTSICSSLGQLQSLNLTIELN